MLKNYLKIAWKVLGRNRFFTFVSLFGISLTIGIILVLAALFEHMFGAHYPEADRDKLLKIAYVNVSNEEQTAMWQEHASFYLINEYVEKMETPERVALSTSGDPINLFVGNKKLALLLKYTCEDFWDVYEFEFLEGQPYRLSHIEEAAPVAVITEATRDDYFGIGQSAVGQRMEINNQFYRVIGVIKNISEVMRFSYADVFLPYSAITGNFKQKAMMGNFYGLIKARKRADLPKIKAEYQALLDRLEKELPAYLPEPIRAESDKYIRLNSAAESDLDVIAEKIFRAETGNTRTLWMVVLVGTLLFMLLPALNLVNLNTSRIQERSSEIGIRKAFGATSATLAVQFVVENIVLTLLGGILALVIAYGVLELIEAKGVIKYAELAINFKLFLLALLLCFFFGILSGMLPAVRMSKIKIVNALKGQVL